MKYKIEKTDEGKISIVKPKRKHATYGDVVNPEVKSEEATYDEKSGGSDNFEEKVLTADNEREKMELLEKLVEHFAKEDETKKEEEKEKDEQKDESEKPKSESGKENEQLTRYLVLQVRLHALNKLFGSIDSIPESADLWTIRVIYEDEHVSSLKVVQRYRGIDRNFLEVMPYFVEKESAEAYFELLSPMLFEYVQLADNLDFLQVAQTKELKVIHK